MKLLMLALVILAAALHSSFASDPYTCAKCGTTQ
jgi:hypothetical protein